MPLFEASPSGGGAHVLSSYATGFWGPHDALHTFCEESYAVTSLAAEPFNAFGSFCYTVVGVVNLWRLSKLGLPLSWRATCGWWSLVIVGLGSSLFHTTMRYHMELLDEIPMLVLVCCGCLQCSDIHPLGKYRWKGITLLDLTLVGGLSVLTVVYLITRIFGLFVTGFTIGTIFLLGLYMTAERNPDYGHLGGRAAVRILLARVAWELENHLCASYPMVWYLHNVWHIGSCLAASDLFLFGYLYRLEKLGMRGIVAVRGGGAEGNEGPVSSASLTPGRMTRTRTRAIKEGIDPIPIQLPLLLFCPEAAVAMVESAKMDD